MTLIYPLVAQVFLTLFIGMKLGRARFMVLKNRDVRLSAIAAGNDAWPLPVKLLTNNFSNQFETPVLFYVLCLAAMQVAATGWPMVTLAWVYFVTRLAHYFIHTGSNNIVWRFRIFVLGILSLVFMGLGVVLSAVH